MTIKIKVGLEAEFLLRNGKNEVIIPPASWDRDGFPLLGEIRAEPGEKIAETITNFMAKKMEILGKISAKSSIQFVARERVPLKLYKLANKQMNAADKEGAMAEIRNIHGTDISEFSDQIISKNRIQGIWVSCGLHVHFSCEELVEYKVEEEQYDPVILPIGINFSEAGLSDAERAGVDEMMRPQIMLYRRKGWKEKKTLKARASRLNWPAIHYIVSQMDKKFFDRFAPPEKERTKYRQPGFYELKPYGFEYRSLPFTPEVEAALPEIAMYAFELLNDING